MKRCYLSLVLIVCALGCGGEGVLPETVTPRSPAQADNGAAAAASTAGEMGEPDMLGGASRDGVDSNSEFGAAMSKLKEAEEAFLDYRHDDALKAVEASLKTDGITRRGLQLKARILSAQARGFIHSEPKRAVALYEQSIAAYQQSEDQFGEVEWFVQEQWGTACYDLACSLALAEDPEQAFIVLKEAYQRGFNNIHHYERDPDLQSVRALPEYAPFREEKFEEARQRIRTGFAEFRPIDVSFEATTLDGEEFATEALKGKILIIDCWATWCPPCREMLPVLVEMHQKYHDQGLEIVGVNFERGEED